jgi:Zn-dependent membrane protease YugP
MIQARKLARTVMLLVAILLFILGAVLDWPNRIDVVGLGLALVALALLFDTIVGITFEARRTP